MLRMDAMDGLMAEGVPLNAIADAAGTPTWIYGAATIRGRLQRLRTALADAGLDAHVHYAVKANDHLAVLGLFAAEGIGADVVSEGEFRRAQAAGIPAARIVYSGVGKSAREVESALVDGIAQINVESAEELDMLSGIAARLGRTTRIALRVNPDVDAGTHAKISTGRAQDKFGIAYDEAAALYRRAEALPGIEPRALAVHIGSQILSVGPYRDAYDLIADLVRELRSTGSRIDTVDCGGGLGIGYNDEPEGNPAALAGAIRASLGSLDVRVMLEPGRWLVGPAGLLLASVVLVKREAGTRYVVLDAAMNDLIRPAMYDAFHSIIPVSPVEARASLSPADIVGPVCESGDTFARGRPFAEVAPNARVAILDAGAYGSVMSSNYNARPLAAIAMVDGDRWSVIRPRQPVEAMWAAERMPDWLKRQ